MGINTTIFVIKPLADRGVNRADILKELLISAIVEQENIDFESTLSILWKQTSPAAIAITIYGGKTIFIDDGCNIDLGIIPQFTASYPAEVLRIENSDTTDTGVFQFWKDGALIRQLSFGMEQWMDEMMGLLDEEIISNFAPITIGTPLEFEKEPVNPMTVLTSYALDYFDFYHLRWSICRLTQWKCKNTAASF